MFSQHRILPDALTGYPLLAPSGAGLWSVIEPTASTNLFNNPSLESNLTGYAGFASSETLTRDNTKQRRGNWSLKCITSTSTNRGIVANNGGSGFTLTAGVTYTLSVDFLGAGNVPYILYLSGPSSSTPGTLRVRGQGRWQRLVLTFVPTSTGAHNINLLKENSASIAPFWMDGWQLEVSPFASTYFDGDTRGFDWDYADPNGNTKPSPYQWLGTPHASQSRRLGSTRSGGKRRYLDEFGFYLLSLPGAGLTPMILSDSRLANGGGMFQRAVRDIRILGLIGVLVASSPIQLEAQAYQLHRLLTPEDGPAMLVYQDHDDVDESYVPVVYESGLEGAMDNNYQMQAPLQFRVYAPITSGYDVSAQLNYSIDIPNTNAVASRNADGTWSALGTGMSGTLGGLVLTPQVHQIKRGFDNNYYLAGNWVTSNGVTSNGIAKWDGTNFTALGTGSNNTVQALAIGPDNSIYAAGLGTIGGVAGVAKWNGSAWSSIGTVAGGTVYELSFSPDGTLYAAGDFTSINGVANTNKVAKWNGSAWSAVDVGGTTPNGTVLSVQVDTLNNVYIGGSFTTIGAGTYNRVAMYNATANTWQALGTGMDSGGIATLLLHGGYLYAGGAFTTADGTIANRVARWNGSAWQPLGVGLYRAAGGGNVRRLAATSDGKIYATGVFDRTGTTILPDNMAYWNGFTWSPLDIDTPSTSTYGIYAGDEGTIFVGFDASGTSKSAVTTVNNPGSDKAYPTVTFTGPGQIHQLYNYTTGDVIYFSNLILSAGETATLRLDPNGVSFDSSFRGSLLSYIGPGSNETSWKLITGNNNVSSFMTGTTTATSIYLRFRPPLGKVSAIR